MFSWFKNLFFGQPEEAEPIAPTILKKPKWKLEPDNEGTYTLYEWLEEIDYYSLRAVLVRDEKHAEELIANLEREVLYHH